MTAALGGRGLGDRGSGRRPIRGRAALLALCLVVAAARPVLAAGAGDRRLELGAPSVRGDHVWLPVAVARLLQGDVMDALNAGLPATVIFEWRIWERRAGMWDRRIGSGETSYRIFYDMLQNRYDVFDYRGRPIAFSDNLPEIERSISELPGLRLIATSELAADRTFYVEVRAGVELLDDEEIGRLNEWLMGPDEERKRFDIMESVSERLSRALGRMLGPENRTAVSRTADFAGFSRR